MDERNIEPSAKWEIRLASEELGRRIYAEPVRRGFLAVKRAKKSPCARVRCSYPEPDKTPILCPGATGVVHQGASLHHSSVEIKHPTALEVLVAAQARGRHLSAGQSLDIAGLPDGTYWPVVTADPDNLLDEGEDAAFETQEDKDSFSEANETAHRRP